MIVSPDIDAVFVATVNALNKPITIAALQAGKHVFCEKPPAFTGADVMEIMAVERTSRRKLMYGFQSPPAWRRHSYAQHRRQR